MGWTTFHCKKHIPDIHSELTQDTWVEESCGIQHLTRDKTMTCMHASSIVGSRFYFYNRIIHWSASYPPKHLFPLLIMYKSYKGYSYAMNYIGCHLKEIRYRYCYYFILTQPMCYGIHPMELLPELLFTSYNSTLWDIWE